MIPHSCLGSGGLFSPTRLTLELLRSCSHLDQSSRTVFQSSPGARICKVASLTLMPELGRMGFLRANEASLSPHGLNNKVAGSLYMVAQDSKRAKEKAIKPLTAQPGTAQPGTASLPPLLLIKANHRSVQIQREGNQAPCFDEKSGKRFQAIFYLLQNSFCGFSISEFHVFIQTSLRKLSFTFMSTLPSYSLLEQSVDNLLPSNFLSQCE